MSSQPSTPSSDESRPDESPSRSKTAPPSGTRPASPSPARPKLSRTGSWPPSGAGTEAGPTHRRRPRRSPATRTDLALHDPIADRDVGGPAYLRTGSTRSAVPPVYSVSDPEAGETSRWRVIAGDGLLAPLYGVRMDRAPTEEITHPAWADDEWFAERARLAAVQSRRPGALGSHSTAALLHGIPLPTYARRRRSPVHVVSPEGSAVRLRGVQGHRGRIVEQPVEVGGVSVCGALQTLVQLAPMLTERDLIIAVEGLMGPWHGPAISPDAVAAAAVRHAGARGLVRLRSALSRARPGVGSPQESELRLDLVELGFP